MNPKRRELILTIADGHQENLSILYHLDRFKHSERILEFFVRNKITGRKFFELYQNEFKLSWLSMGKWAVMKINKSKELRPIIGGRDYRV